MLPPDAPAAPIPWPAQVADGAVTVEVSDAVYPVPAVLGAAALFLERAWLRLETPTPGRTRLHLRPKLPLDEAELESLGGELLNELLHQALRGEVAAGTDKLRELVLGRAILSAESGAQGIAFHDDPLGIARPWEERYLGEDNGGRR